MARPSPDGCSPSPATETFAPSPIAPADLLHGLTEVLEPALGPSIRMQIEAPPGLPAVIADKGQLETALINLATNARDAMPSGGVLVLSAVTETVPDRPNALSLRPGHYVQFTVTDTGVGMDAATLARVTEPFFTTKPAGEGTGLGLPMVKGFAEQSGGAFHIESNPGFGTRAAIWLPQVETALVRPTVGVPEPERPPRARVLFVDDDATIRELMSTLLEDIGYATLVAQSGMEAMALLNAGERHGCPGHRPVDARHGRPEPDSRRTGLSAQSALRAADWLRRRKAPPSRSRARSAAVSACSENR